MLNHKLLFFLTFLLQILFTYSKTIAIVGGNTSIGVFEVTDYNGHMSFLSSVNISSPSPWFATYPPKNPNLLAATGNNTIILYSINPTSSNLTKLSEVSTGGLNPAYVSWDLKGNYLLVANYGFNDSISNGSNVAVIPVVKENGSFSLRNATTVVAHNGSSVNPDRQAGSHTHGAFFSPDGNYAFACDLGLDQIFEFVWPGDGSLPANPSESAAGPAQLGAGPRHLAFHPNNIDVFLITEMLSTIDHYQYQADGSLIGPFSSTSTLPANFTGTSEAAEIAITPNGRFLYASNRGYDSIVAYIVDSTNTDFPLKPVGWYTANVVWPRSFTIDPTGELLYVGSQNSNRVVVYRINQIDGQLTLTGAQHNFPFPQVLQVLSVPNGFSEPAKWGIVTHAIIATMVFSVIFAIFILSTLIRMR